MEDNKKCGCKGIRTCLICQPDIQESEKDCMVIEKYIYCPHCNLCWPTNKNAKSPLYLGHIKLFLNFINPEEEESLINSIDQIPWSPSQSGRKKQDFGPKVNFKKKKAKIGNFKGLPKFSQTILERFQQCKELSDFYPVELCHLDYSPDRGSAIDPHIDDFWIWGGRLVTVNLASSTVLTLSPANLENCKCSIESKKDFFDEILLKEPIAELSCSHQLACFESTSIDPKKLVQITHNNIDNGESEYIADMCSMYRRYANETKVEIQIVLPPRSLLILGGCSRYNWFHAIKRQDISSRRLAMTFRELSESFLEDDNEKKLADELLELGRIFFNP
ncbi:alpha-ketoglutarate-dependent dioxygenase alkB homolog 4 [Caerostris darwini]|uniref:Alpha-ketoglutarate-dependent dioxygenase alkB homolog 4 n=1 Tax=Caerostris darwini TaxID=1538125 RepID=A0AAV4QB27_9ARAC|nr:alpha-ketoglutarate-dependent dioxygenase alkB homolog 4 [Caerostris darwini]